MNAEQKQHEHTEHPKSSYSGFSLIELLVVVAVILIIAAIAIPNFIRAKISANESSAVQNLHVLTTAEVAYSTEYSMGFSPNLADLGGNGGSPVTSTSAQLIDSVLSAGIKSGYVFTYIPSAADSAGNIDNYTINADPQSPGITGQRHFYVDQTYVIRENDTAAAGPNDSPIQ